MKTGFQCTILLMLAAVLHAQRPVIAFEHYTYQHGLSAPVTCIAQDTFGFLWLGTNDGLNRFDGRQFVVYRAHPSDPAAPASDVINDLHVDHAGRIWVATNRGLCYYDYTDAAFHRIAFHDSVEHIDRYRVFGVTSTQNGEVWFASKTHVHMLDHALQSCALFISDSPGLHISKITTDRQDRIWIGTNKGVYVFDPATQDMDHNALEIPFVHARNLTVTCGRMVPMHSDTMLAATWYGGLQKLFYTNDQLAHVLCEDNMETDPRKYIVRSFAPGIQPGEWWVGTFGTGISWYDARVNRFTAHFRHDPAFASSLSNDYVNAVFRDASGIYWIGTHSGLDKYDPLSQQFGSVPLPHTPQEFSVYRLARTIVEDNNDPSILWVCASGLGLLRYHIPSQEFHIYEHDSRNPRSLPDNSVMTYYEDPQGRTWIGMRSGVCLFDKSSGTFSPAPVDAALPTEGINTILQDTRGDLWFASNAEGISRYDTLHKKVTRYRFAGGDVKIPDDHVFCMIESRSGHLWFGTQNRGVIRIDPASNDILHLEHRRDSPDVLPDNGVFDLYEDADGDLWMATENGLARMRPDNRITVYTTQDGLGSNTIYKITPDHRGFLWLSTNNGLTHLDPVSGHCRVYTTGDGLPSNRMSSGNCMTRNGMFYFSTEGLLGFCHPEVMQTNTRVPSVVITGYRILDTPRPALRNGNVMRPVHLSYRQNMITFHFAALNFTQAGLNRYAYKLTGFDDDWIDNGNRQSATYTNLGGGTYTFRVIAANNDGIWNETGSTVVLVVHPPFWRTWWFYLSCIVALTIALYMFYRMRIAQIMRVQRIRTHIARDLHDDVGSTLSSIHMISRMAAGNGSTAPRAPDMFRTIAVASQEAMSVLQDIVWSINPKNDRMEMILTRMRQYASEILEAADVTFTIEMDASCRQLTLPMELRKDFHLIFKEAVNNMAKYAHAQNATIRLMHRDHMLMLCVKDDGCGFDPAQVLYGNGLKNMKERAAHIRADLFIRSAPGEGTTVELHVPLTP